VFEKDGLYYLMLLKTEENEAYLFEEIQVEVGESTDNLVVILNHESLSQKAKYLVGGNYLVGN